MHRHAERLAVARGWDDTALTLRRWRARPSAALRPWTAWSLAVALALLAATWAVAAASQPEAGVVLHFPGVTSAAGARDFGLVLLRNSLVLALHALACVAGFIAGSSLPVAAEGYTGLYRRAHDLARPLAIGFVTAATLFSLGTQAYVLGHDAATLAHQFGMSPAGLLGVMSLHAVPELTALFLPLAAWSLASRRKRWDELLAATFATVAAAAPVLVVCAAVEVWVTPRVLLVVVG